MATFNDVRLSAAQFLQPGVEAAGNETDNCSTNENTDKSDEHAKYAVTRRLVAGERACIEVATCGEPDTFQKTGRLIRWPELEEPGEDRNDEHENGGDCSEPRENGTNSAGQAIVEAVTQALFEGESIAHSDFQPSNCGYEVTEGVVSLISLN